MVVVFIINSSFQFQQQIRLYVLLKCFYIYSMICFLSAYYCIIYFNKVFMDIHSWFWMNFSLTYPSGCTGEAINLRTVTTSSEALIISCWRGSLRLPPLLPPSPLLQSRPLLPHLTSPPLRRTTACGSPYIFCPSRGRSCFSSSANSQDNVPFHHHLFGSSSQKQIVEKMSFSG